MEMARLSFSDRKGGSFDDGLYSRIGYNIFIRSMGAEVKKIERQYGNITVVTSALTIYVFYGPKFVSLWPLLLSTFTIAHSLVHLLFSATACIISSIALKAHSSARNSEYITVQKEVISVTPFTLVSKFHGRLLHRHQDRGCSDSAPNDNLLRRNLILFPASLRAAQFR